MCPIIELFVKYIVIWLLHDLYSILPFPFVKHTPPYYLSYSLVQVMTTQRLCYALLFYQNLLTEFKTKQWQYVCVCLGHMFAPSLECSILTISIVIILSNPLYNTQESKLTILFQLVIHYGRIYKQNRISIVQLNCKED